VLVSIIYLPLPDVVHEWRRVLKPGGVAAFSTLRHDSPRAGVVFREVAATFGVYLDNPNAIGAPASCRELVDVAGFEDIEIASESLADLERMRAAYIATLTAGDLDAPHAGLFVVARRPPD